MSEYQEAKDMKIVGGEFEHGEWVSLPSEEVLEMQRLRAIENAGIISSHEAEPDFQERAEMITNLYKASE